MTSVLFAAEAGPGIGLGHLSRCLAIAMALRARGWAATFAPIAAGGDVVAQSGFSVEAGTVDLSVRAIAALARARGASTIVVDSYAIDGQWLAEVRSEGFLVVALDDHAAFEFPCQVVVNGGAQAVSLPYRSATGDTTFLLGTEYIALASDVSDARADDSVEGRVLVTVGGADPLELLEPVTDILASTPGVEAVAVVVGPFVDRRPLERVQCAADADVSFLSGDPVSLRQEMRRASIAVAGGGHTLYELAALGTPAVALLIAENQWESMRALEAAGAVRVAGRAGLGKPPVGLETEVASLLEDSVTREAMTAAGRRMVDGRGASRVAEVIEQGVRRAAAV